MIGISQASQTNLNQKIATSYIGREVIVSATVVDLSTTNNQVRLQLGDIQFNDSTKVLNCQAYAFLTGENSSISRSDRIMVRAKVQPGFGDYAFAVYRPVIVASSKPDPPDYAALARFFISSRLRKLLDNPTADLALGFLVGEKSLPPELKNQLKIVGLSHIVVASGFSLSILIGAAKKWVGKISRFAGFVSALILMLLFMSVAGLGPSLLRAGLVSGLSLFSEYFGRKFHPGRLLIYVAAISAIVNPPIIFSLAWQLSLASYAGIMFLSPLLKKFFYGDKRPNSLAEIIIVTVSAQLYCLPISLYNFGQFSIIGIVGNILVTPLISAVMSLSLVTGASPGAFAVAIAQLDKVILSCQIAIIQHLSAIKWATVNIAQYSPTSLLLYILVFIATLVLWRVTRHSYRPVPTLDNRQKYGKIYAC